MVWSWGTGVYKNMSFATRSERTERQVFVFLWFLTWWQKNTCSATSGYDRNDMNKKSTVKDILSSGHIHTSAYSMTVLCRGWAWGGGANDSCCSHLIFNSAVDGLLLLADDVLLCAELGVRCDDVLEPKKSCKICQNKQVFIYGKRKTTNCIYFWYQFPKFDTSFNDSWIGKRLTWRKKL